MIRRSLSGLHPQLRSSGESELPDATSPAQRDGRAPARPCDAERQRMAGLDVQLYAARLEADDSRVRGNRPLAQALADAARQLARTNDELEPREPGRLELLSQLQAAIEDMFRRHRRLALMFIDLHGFELPQARGFTRGPGTNLLTLVATRTEDHDGDDVAASGDVVNLAGITEAIRGHVEGSYCIDGRGVEIGATVGIALAPLGSQRREALLGCTGLAAPGGHAATVWPSGLRPRARLA